MMIRRKKDVRKREKVILTYVAEVIETLWRYLIMTAEEILRAIESLNEKELEKAIALIKEKYQLVSSSENGVSSLIDWSWWDAEDDDIYDKESQNSKT